MDAIHGEVAQCEAKDWGDEEWNVQIDSEAFSLIILCSVLLYVQSF